MLPHQKQISVYTIIRKFSLGRGNHLIEVLILKKRNEEKGHFFSTKICSNFNNPTWYFLCGCFLKHVSNKIRNRTYYWHIWWLIAFIKTPIMIYSEMKHYIDTSKSDININIVRCSSSLWCSWSSSTTTGRLL